MKKSLFTAFVLLCAAAGGLVSGCKNFLEGSNLNKDIQNNVEYALAPFAQVTINSLPAEVDFISPANGNYNKEYKVTDEIELEVTPKKTYRFEKWVVNEPDSVTIVNPKSPKTKVIIKKADKPIIIEPKIYPKDKLSIIEKVENGSGELKISDGLEYCLNDTFTIRFEESRDYAFIRWEVKDLDNNPADDFLKITSKNSNETVCEVLDVNKQVCLYPVCSIRPNVVSTSPIYEFAGVYRDRRIIVMFDQEISEESIYLTQDEQKYKTDEGYVLLIDEFSGNCYGYWDGINESSKVFKNIKITNYLNKDENFLKYYLAPYFNYDNKQMLYIETKGGSFNPPPGSEILVTISRDFFYENSNKDKILLNKDKSFPYKINGQADDDGPVFTTLSTDNETFSVRIIPENIEVNENTSLSNIGDDKLLSNCEGNTNLDIGVIPKDNDKKTIRINSKKIEKINALSKKFWVKGGLYDGAAGPESLYYNVYKIQCLLDDVNDRLIYPEYSENYKPINSNRIPVYIDNKNPEAADVNTDIDLSSYVTEEGIYRITFFAYDNNQNESTKDFYFVYDDKKPEEYEDMFFTAATKSKIKAGIYIPESCDVEEISIIKEGSEENVYNVYNTKDFNRETVQYFAEEYSNSGVNENNEFTIKLRDYAGNEYEFKHNECLKVGNIYYSDNTCSQNLTKCKTPIGVVCNTSDMSKVRIWDLSEQSGYMWGRAADSKDNHSPPFADNHSHFDVDDGAHTLEIYITQFNSQVISFNGNGHTYFWWVLNERRPGGVLDWYIPTQNELNCIAQNYNDLAETYRLLNDNGISATFLGTSSMTTSIPRDINNSTCLYYYTANIIGQNNIGFGYAKRDSINASQVHCMAQVNLQ